MNNSSLRFTMEMIRGSLQEPIDLLSLSDILRKDYPDLDQFLLESLSGPSVDTKESILGLGVLFCAEVQDGIAKLSGDIKIVNRIETCLSTLNLNKMTPSVTMTFIRNIERCGTVLWPDGSFGKLPLLTIIGYDAMAPQPQSPGQISMPDLGIILPKAVIHIDHWSKTYSVMTLKDDEGQFLIELKNTILRSFTNRAVVQNKLPITKDIIVRPTVSASQYMNNVKKCKEHILQGDIYQIQLGHEVLAHTGESALSLYKRLRQFNPSPYMFFVPLPSVTLVGASPELFIRIDEGKIQMRPLAGTLSKTAMGSGDKLRRDQKEQAEHIMLVDLCRNDIGRIAKIGSVQVPQLLYAEEYSKVFHLVSTITGLLRDDLDVWDAIESCSPAGTMTGTPKIRAMSIIAEHEWTKRGFYAGSIAFSDGRGNLVSALIIRTLIMQNGWVSVRASAGIVADSVPEKEWLETLAKIGSSFAAVTVEPLQTFL